MTARLLKSAALTTDTDPIVDLAIRMREPIAHVLQQHPNDLSEWG